MHAQTFSAVDQYFMEPGHSYLPCDRDFDNFELELKGKEVYITDHYISLMRE